ncbi:MAG: type II secretion system F family protein [archaeon]
MNTLKIYPKKLRNIIVKSIERAGQKLSPEKYNNRIIIFSAIIAIIAGIIFYLTNIKIYFTPLVFIVALIFFLFKINLEANARIQKMEKIFPDVISLMSSNLKAGMTIDRSFLLSAREEFAPLDEEILKTGKDISTGNSVVYSLNALSKRIGSEKISKTILLIISGIRAGGNISDLLEQTSSNMREKEFIEKRASSNILMYVIFIFFAIGVGAPLLFALSSVLVEIIINLSAQIPAMDPGQFSLPFSFSGIGITSTFVIYFSVVFLIATDITSSLIIGVVNKGDSKAGLRYLIPLIASSIGIFFIVRVFLLNFLLNVFAF